MTAPAEADQRHEDVAVRQASLAFAAKLVGGLFTAVLTVFLARRLGTAGYGVFALALSIVTLAVLPADFGIAASLPRFIAERRHERDLVAEFVADAVLLKLIGCFAAGGGLAAFAGLIASAYHEPGLAWPLRAMAIALIGQNFVFLFLGVFGAMRRWSLVLLTSVIESAAEATASVVLVVLLGGATAAGFGRSIGYACGAAAGLVLALRLLGPGVAPRGRRTHGHARRIAAYARSIFIVDAAFTLFTQIDSLLIGAFLTVGSVATWQAPLRLVTLLIFPAQAIASVVTPRLARSGEQQPDVESFNSSVRLVVLLMGAMTAVTTTWSEPIVRLTLGSEYGHSAAVLRELAPFVFLSGLTTLVSVGLTYLGAARRRVPIAIATAVLNLVIDLVLIPRMGIAGGAVGTDVASMCYVLAHYVLCQRILDIPLRPVLTTLLRGAFAAVAMALVLSAFGLDHLGLASELAGGLAGIVVYVGVLGLTREVSIADVRRTRELIRQLRSARR